MLCAEGGSADLVYCRSMHRTVQIHLSCGCRLTVGQLSNRAQTWTLLRADRSEMSYVPLALTFGIALAASRGYTSEYNIDTYP
jgi:hypothetical protein